MDLETEAPVLDSVKEVFKERMTLTWVLSTEQVKRIRRMDSRFVFHNKHEEI
jgi:hypothetical protein